MNPSPGPWKWADAVPVGEFCLLAGGAVPAVMVSLPTDEHFKAPLPDDATLIAAAPEMRGMLLKLEWVVGFRGAMFCPSCGVQAENACTTPKGFHADKCVLDALLERLR